MKNKILSLLFLASTLFVEASPSFSQVNYNENFYRPFNSGISFNGKFVIGRIKVVTDYVNGRQGPSTNYIVISSFFSNDVVKVLRYDYDSNDGYFWWLVYEPTRNQYGWVREDFVNNLN